MKVLKLAADLEGNFAARCNCKRHLNDVQQHVHRDFDHDGLIGNRPDKRTHYSIYKKSVFSLPLKESPENLTESLLSTTSSFKLRPEPTSKVFSNFRET